MRSLIAGWLLIVVLTGCATTPSTIESRRQERVTEYNRLSADEKAAADQGRIREGMSMDAAYVAWGKPTRTIAEGATTTWLYEDSKLKEHKSITIRNSIPEETSILYPHRIVQAKIVFTNGLVKEWRRQDKPAY